ncbi:MAG: acyltransferase [Nitrospirota bacterium]
MTYKKIHCLTSLRFLAAAMIVVHHSRGVLWLTPDHLKHWALDQAVSFFFVLSGFVLTYVYPMLGGTLSVKKFYLARFARIWPNHLAAFVALFVIFLPGSFYSIKGVNHASVAMLNILLVHSWIPVREIFFSFNAVTWAVSVEVFFYLLFPLLIKDFETTYLRKIALSLLLVFGIVSFCNVLHLPSDGAVSPTTISRTALVYINPPCRLFEFVLGMCVALLWRKHYHHIKLNKIVGTLLEVFAICVVLLSVYYSISAGNLVRLVGPAGSEYLCHAGSAVAFASLIFIMAMEAGFISKVLNLKLPVLLGDASYSIFLFHQIILRFYTVNAGLFSYIPQVLLYIIFLFFLLIISFLVLIVIERPCRRLLMGFIK